jgi:hypothetical protein
LYRSAGTGFAVASGVFAVFLSLMSTS